MYISFFKSLFILIHNADMSSINLIIKLVFIRFSELKYVFQINSAPKLIFERILWWDSIRKKYYRTYTVSGVIKTKSQYIWRNSAIDSTTVYLKHSTLQIT